MRLSLLGIGCLVFSLFMVPSRVEASLVESDKDKLWPDGIIPYVINPELSNPFVLDAIQHWNENTVIRLVERTDQENWVRFVPGRRCQAGWTTSSSESGRQNATISLSENCSLTGVIHEIGHIVGLWHEHQRNDRDRHIWIAPDAPGWNDLMGSSGLDSGPYDYGSVMHYSGSEFRRSIPPGIPLASGGSGLSAGDIDGVSRLYGRIPDNTTIATNPSGLLIEVDGRSYVAPHSFDWKPDSLHTISIPNPQDRSESTCAVCGPRADLRYLFAKWSDGGSQNHSVRASSGTTVFIANFIRQVSPKYVAEPPHGGFVRFEPPSASGFYTFGSFVKAIAEPAEGFSFEKWQSGSYGSSLSLNSAPRRVGLAFHNKAFFNRLPPVKANMDSPASDRVTGTLAEVKSSNLEISANVPFFGFPASLFVAVEGENPSAQELDIRKSGGGTLDYRIATDQSWLFVSTDRGSSKGEKDTVEIAVDSESLDTGVFEGTVTITTLPARPGSTTVEVPVTVLVYQGLLRVLNFAHFANGGGITSDLVFVNVGTHPTRPILYFRDKRGNLIDPESIVEITGNLEVIEDGALSVLADLEPLEEITISTHGQGEVVSGSVKVVSKGPLGGFLRFDMPGIGVAGVESSPTVLDVIFPARRQGGLSTATAIHNMGGYRMDMKCRLMKERVVLEEVKIRLDGYGQEAQFIEEMFTRTDTSDFVGSVYCSAEELFTGIAVELDAANRIFTTLPFIPVR